MVSKKSSTPLDKVTANTLESVADKNGKTRWQVFSDFIEVATIEFANTSAPVKDATWKAR